MWISTGTGISKIEIMLFTSVVASAAGSYLRMKDIMRLCANFLWCVPSRWIKNVWFLLAITASKRRNVLSILICLKLDLVQLVILCFFLFPGFHMIQTRPQSSAVYLLRLVARPDREFSRGICDKCRKGGNLSKSQKLIKSQCSLVPEYTSTVLLFPKSYLKISLVP